MRLQTGQVSEAVIDPNNANTLYICVHDDGIYKSTDGGTTFITLNNAPSGTSATWPKIALSV
jgi:hypothetical protein